MPEIRGPVQSLFGEDIHDGRKHQLFAVEPGHPFAVTRGTQLVLENLPVWVCATSPNSTPAAPPRAWNSTARLGRTEASLTPASGKVMPASMPLAISCQILPTVSSGSIRSSRCMALNGPFGVGGGEVEEDETFICKEPGKKKPKNAIGGAHKMKMMTLVDRNRGMAKSVVVDDLTKATMAKVVSDNMSREARMITDEYRQYKLMADEVAAEHQTINHVSGEYGRVEIHANTVEGFYSIFKRSMKGVYQHCG